MSGLIALAGALCWAELATVFPRQGGTYIFIKEGLGDLPAFVYIYMRSVLSMVLSIIPTLINDYLEGVPAESCSRSGAVHSSCPVFAR